MGKKKILIVDDEKGCCEFFKIYFKNSDYLTDIAFDGRQAKYLLEDNKYAYIFFDCNMPELSGVELIKIIKKTNPKARAIMISGYDLINEDFAKELDVDAFLSKPISIEDVEKVMRPVKKKA